MVASPGGKIGPVYELGQRFSVGELCYVRQLSGVYAREPNGHLFSQSYQRVRMYPHPPQPT